VQDTLLGAKLITQRDTFIPRDVMMNILMNIQEWDGTVPAPTILKPQPLWTGKQVGHSSGHVIVCVTPCPGCWFVFRGVGQPEARTLPQT
jgi:DNA-directed RNA polymerase beta' subunit